MKLPDCKYDDTEMELATVHNRPDLWLEDHGFLVLDAVFDYGGSSQGLGNMMTIEFLRKFMHVWNAEYLRDCVGHVFVERGKGMAGTIMRLININTGAEFDIRELNKHGRQQ